MFGFRPARSSPPAKAVGFPQQRPQDSTNPADLSRSSAFSAVPELAGLLLEEVELIDAIIERAGPNATTFLTVFKAYNDILLERGLDPHEVVYYGKLLKLGTLKGSSWGEKWDAIKTQNGYGIEMQRSAVKAEPMPIPTKLPIRSGVVTQSRPGPSTILSDDLFSSTSALRVSQNSETDDESVLDGLHTYPASSTVFPSRKGYSPSALTNNLLGLEIDDDIPRPLSTPVPAHTLSRKAHQYLTEKVSPTPLSYRDFPSRSTSPTKKLERLTPAKTTLVASQPTERKNSAINEEEAWKKVRMIQDEKTADRFRKERLVEHCFDVWRQGFQWSITANEQVGEARNNLLMQKVFVRWYDRTASRNEFYKRVDVISNILCQRAFFRIWKHLLKQRLKEKQQAEWRQDMRMKIQLVKHKRDVRILKEAWSQWVHSHKLIAAEQHFDVQLVVRLFQRWKTRLRGVYEKEAIADQRFQNGMDRVVEVYWDHWRSSTDLSRMEKVMSERVGLRIMSEAMDTWNKKMHDMQTADAFYDVIIVKNAIRSWKAARDRIRSLDARLKKHTVRQDDILLRAVMRVWKAHERGKLLEKVKAFRLTKTAWAVWKVQVDNQRTLEDLALQFSTRLFSSSTKSMFLSWRRALSTQQSAQLLAIRKHSVGVFRRALLQWRLQLHTQLKMAKKARVAEKFLVLRKSWGLLKDRYKSRFCERVADKQIRSSQQLVVKKFFQMWSERSHKLRHERLAEELIQDHVRKRILSNALALWTNRVIEIKVLELEVAQRNEAVLLITAFGRWKRMHVRHIEHQALLQSHLDIKREDHKRNIFHRWLSTTRIVVHRRAVLRQNEREFAKRVENGRVRAAFYLWRKRFQKERLRPLELQFHLQNKEALKYRAFVMWFSKTQSLPAIHFDAQRVKTKYWQVWKSALPGALLARKAKDVDKKALLKNFLGKWLQVYRTKLTLKAVARARYFPTPSEPAARPSPFSRLPPLSFAPRSNTSRNIFPRRAARSESPDEEAGSSHALPNHRFSGLGSRLAIPPRARSEVSPTRTLISASKTRASSPARSSRSAVPLPSYLRDRSPVRPSSPSSAGGEERSSLWQEIQNVRKKSQTPSEISRPFRKPP